jgi:hypothetical protein
MYIRDSDITDMLARQFLTSFPTYHTLTDAQMLNIAEQRGIFDVSLFLLTVSVMGRGKRTLKVP